VFLKFYNLREQPFGTTPNPRFLYPSVVHREALASLIYGVESNLGFAALIAEPGMGKTTLLFHLLTRLKNSARTAFLFETQCNSESLLRYLLAELRVPTTDPDPVVLHEKFKQVLYEESRMGRRVVVIIDEAQNLDAKVLETVRLLSDFETAEAKLLHIILVGQPQLAKQLGSPKMSQLLQRIPMMNFLRPLEPGEVAEYIDHRLCVAGYSGPQLFTTSALERIAELSNGVPRKINRICFNALSLGCALATKQIERSLIDEVGADLDLDLLLKNVKASHPVSVGAAVSILNVSEKTAETPSAEIGQVGKVTVAENVIPDSTQAAPETTGRVATTEDGWRMQPRTSPRIRSSAALDSDPAGLNNQQWKEDVREALAYIQEFLARYKPVVTTPQG
jgi:general secretion pathway protein A